MIQVEQRWVPHVRDSHSRSLWLAQIIFYKPNHSYFTIYIYKPKNLWVCFSQPHGTAICEFPSLYLTHPKNVLLPQFPNTILVSFSASSPTFMGLASLSPLAQQYVSFAPLNLKHPKCVLLLYPNAVLGCDSKNLWVSFPSAPCPTICEFPFPQP